MLGMLALMAVTLAGADEGSCARLVDEVGLAGSTLGREEARAAAADAREAGAPAGARNR